MSVSNIDCVNTFCYNVICVNNDVCGSLCVQYKYNGNILTPLLWEI